MIRRRHTVAQRNTSDREYDDMHLTLIAALAAALSLFGSGAVSGPTTQTTIVQGGPGGSSRCPAGEFIDASGECWSPYHLY
jgi:hypothetical protein